MARFVRYLLAIVIIACTTVITLLMNSLADPVDMRLRPGVASGVSSIGDNTVNRVPVANLTKPTHDVGSADVPAIKTGRCRVIDMNSPSEGDFFCTRLRVAPNPHVCVYKNKADDKWVSGAIHQGGVWEAANVRLLLGLLKKDPRLGLLDIGANFGQFSMLAAGLGRPVLAVEALEMHTQMQKRAAILNNFQDRLVIVHNVVSDDYRTVSLATHIGNMGSTHVVLGEKTNGTVYAPQKVPTILMDDLADVIPFQRGIMKIDIEGHESRAMVHSDVLFSKVYFPYVLMEWVGSKQKKGDDDIILVENLLQKMLARGYKAYAPGRDTVLDPDKWEQWPFDVFWKHADSEIIRSL